MRTSSTGHFRPLQVKREEHWRSMSIVHTATRIDVIFRYPDRVPGA
jgi:hypothetical protein